MRLICATLLALALFGTTSDSYASNVVGGSSAILQTKWEVPVGLTAASVWATTDSMVVVSDSVGVLFAFNALDRKLLWSVSGSPNAPGLVLRAVDILGDKVLASYQPSYDPTNKAKSIIQAFSAENGAAMWSITVYQAGYRLSVGYNMIFVAESVPGVGSVLATYDGSSGQPIWNRTVSAVQLTVATSIGDGFVALEGLSQEGTLGMTFDASTGASICKYSADFGGHAVVSVAGDIVLGIQSQQHQNQALYNATTAANSTTASSETGKEIGECQLIAVANEEDSAGRAVDGEFFFFNPSKRTVTCYANGQKSWSTQLQNVSAKESNGYFGVSPAPFQSEAVILNVGGTFSAINRTNGCVMWAATAQQLPFAPSSPNTEQQSYPLGNKMLMVPNIQGWVILDTHSEQVVSMNEHTPLHGTASFMDAATGKPFVVVGDIAKGALRAVGL